MLRNRSIPNAAAIPVLIYADVRATVSWLSEAFGFVERLQIGEEHRSQMNVGEGGAVIVGDVRYDRVPPRQGEVTHSVLVRVEDASAHCERARAHGAKIFEEPTDHVYGERQYSAEDPWGHQWTFSQTLGGSSQRIGAGSCATDAPATHPHRAVGDCCPLPVSRGGQCAWS